MFFTLIVLFVKSKLTIMLKEQEQNKDYSKFIILKKVKLLFDPDYSKYSSVILLQNYCFINSNLIVRNYQKFYYYFVT